MDKTALPLLLILLLYGISPLQAAEVIAEQHLHQIEALQRRADTLAFGGTGSSNYHLAKARIWLDFALSEYYAMDNSGVVSAAIGHAETLLDALEQKKPDIVMHTPIHVPGSEVVHPDLWDRVAALKNHANFSCGQRQIAEAEVHLVWAGHEKAEYGWSHAEPYARTAENLVHKAQEAFNSCAEANPVPATPQPHIVERITRSSGTLFEFGKAALNPSALRNIDKLLDSIKLSGTLEDVALIGHTDHLRKDGREERNLQLSRQRAESIKQYLVAKGIPADKIHAGGVGSMQPLTECPPRLSMKKQIACLQPNRRVEIILRSVKQR